MVGKARDFYRGQLPDWPGCRYLGHIFDYFFNNGWNLILLVFKISLMQRTETNLKCFIHVLKYSINIFKSICMVSYYFGEQCIILLWWTMLLYESEITGMLKQFKSL